MYIRWVARLIKSLPGKKYGDYRILPWCFLVGAGMEFLMIKWKPMGVNFYKVFEKNQVENEALKQLEREELRDRVFRDLNIEKKEKQDKDTGLA